MCTYLANLFKYALCGFIDIFPSEYPRVQKSALLAPLVVGEHVERILTSLIISSLNLFSNIYRRSSSQPTPSGIQGMNENGHYNVLRSPFKTNPGEVMGP